MVRRQRRFWSDEEKRRIVAQTRAPGVSVSVVARRYDVNANLVFKWLRDPRYGLVADEAVSFLPVEIAPDRPAPVAEAPALGATVEVELACGTRLRVDARIDEASLTRIIRALRAVS
jgi:transposase